MSVDIRTKFSGIFSLIRLIFLAFDEMFGLFIMEFYSDFIVCSKWQGIDVKYKGSPFCK